LKIKEKDQGYILQCSRAKTTDRYPFETVYPSSQVENMLTNRQYMKKLDRGLKEGKKQLFKVKEAETIRRCSLQRLNKHHLDLRSLLPPQQIGLFIISMYPLIFSYESFAKF
jgi:hypothetical protein